MKKIWQHFKRVFFNPISMIVFITIIGCITALLFNSIEYFLTCISIGISAIVVRCAFTQNRIQKDNIKIQVFDKRYSVFQSVLDSITIIKRDNWDRYILFKESDINIGKQLLEIEESLYNSVYRSKCLFDDNIHSKMIEVNNKFCTVSKSYKDMFITNLAFFQSQNNAQGFGNVFISQALSKNGLGTKEHENELKNKFPEIYPNLEEFAKTCNSYLSFVEECGIIDDFNKYIIIDKLDK